MNKTGEALQIAFEQRRYVWLYEQNYTLAGFVLGLSSTLVLLQSFRDFEENGYAVIRRSAVDKVVYEERSLAFFQRMMKGEGLLERVGIEFEVPLDAMFGALQAIRQQGLLVLLDLGLHQAEKSELHVGQVLGVDELRMQLRQVSSWGEWEEQEKTIATPNIDRVEFSTPYLKALSKYSIRPT